MRKLLDNDFRLLEHLLQLDKDQLLKFVSVFLKKYYKEVVTTEDYVFAKGTIPVALVAHVDTVFDKPPVNIYYDERKGVMWSPEGLGADDRAGVFSILQIIKKGYRPHIIFTMDEEWGGLGAWQLAYDFPIPPFNMNYMIELDRCNTNDCVFYGCTNNEFIEFCESWGFCETIGLYSDICELAPKWSTCAVNLSVGYEDEHTYGEILRVPAMLQTIAKVEHVLKTPELYKRDFTWQYRKPTMWFTCSKCGKKVPDDEVFVVNTKDGKQVLYCCDCIIDNVEWCEVCHEPFVTDPEDPLNRVCHKCRAEYVNLEDVKEII